MARDHTQTLFSMWTDEDFSTNLRFDKLLYNVLIGQPAMNWAGVQPINFKRWRKAMRDGEVLPTELEIKVGLVRLERRRYVFTDDDTGEVLARTRMRVGKVDQQPMVMLSALRDIVAVESAKLAAVLLGELGKLDAPDVKGDSPSASKLRLNLKRAHTAAMTHVETLSKGLAEGLPEPFAEDFPEGLPEGSTKGLPRPGEIEPSPEPSRQGSPKGTGVGVGVEESFSSVGGQVGEVFDESAEIVQPQPNPGRNEPPPDRCRKHINDDTPPPCGACAGHRQHRKRWDETHQAAVVDERSQFWLGVKACTDCDERGWLIEGNAVERCSNHDWPQTTTGVTNA